VSLAKQDFGSCGKYKLKYVLLCDDWIIGNWCCGRGIQSLDAFKIQSIVIFYIIGPRIEGLLMAIIRVSSHGMVKFYFIVFRFFKF